MLKEKRCGGIRGKSKGETIEPCSILNPPDFELGELRLRLGPRFGTVDLGEVEAMRLEVDVHV